MTTPIPVTLAILTGTLEDVSRCPGKGQRRWWLSDKIRRTFYPLGREIPATEGAEIDVSLAPGDYILGCGVATRIPFAVSPTTERIEIEPPTRRVSFVRRLPPVTPLSADDVVHVVGIPSLDGMTWSNPADAFSAVSDAIKAGEIDSLAFADACKAGEAGVRKGQPYPDQDDDSGESEAGYPEISATPAPITIAPIAPEISRPVGTFTFTAGEQIRTQASADRILGDQAALAAFGLIMPPPVVELGGTINSVGRENLARSHQEWAENPRTVDACETLIAAVRSERRIDVPVGIARDVRMLDDGRVTITGWDQPLALEESALRALVSDHSSVMPRAGALMSILPPGVRATVWNAQVPESLTSAARILRTRKHGDQPRAAFASVSPGYQALDADQLAGLVRDALAGLPGGIEARGEASHDPETTRSRIDLIFHADKVVNFAAGDVFKLGARVTSDDSGGGAIRIALLVWRNGCYNLIVVTVSKATMARIVHKGDRRSMIVAVQRGIATVMQAGAPMLSRWGYLRTRKLSDLIESPSMAPAVNLRTLMYGLVGDTKAIEDRGLPTLRPGAIPVDGVIDTAGIERDAIVEMLLRGHAAEPGDSLADVVNAVTRLHREKVPVPVLRSAENAAGVLTNAWGLA